MRTDELIAELARSPWPRVRPAMRMAAAMLGGWAVALAGLVIVLGPPLAAVPDTGVLPFGVKTGFTFALALLSAFAAIAAGRPGQRLAPRAALLALPLVIVATLAALELGSTPREAWGGLLFGSTFETCVTAIALASVPVFFGTVWAYRVLAPTAPAVAGLLAGLSSGAAAAVAYALYCPETTASFLLASYTPGLLIPAVAGALLGPRLLRW
jgi:hypothetical protein